MIIGVAHYCENENCRVEIYSVGVDDVVANKNNCPGCGQFGRSKGRPGYQPVRPVVGVPAQEPLNGKGYTDVIDVNVNEL